MQIPTDITSEKNYEGTRLIEINDKTVSKLQNELKKFQAEAEPFIKEMERQSPNLDAIYSLLKPIEEERKKLKDQLEPLLIPYRKEMEKADKVYQKAQLIKNKITPIVNKIVAPELKEFELAKELLEKDGKIYVEVVDELEEKIKAIRASKTKK